MRPHLRSFAAGLRAVFPLLLGVFPFGLIYGALALDAGIPPPAAQAMSSIVFAGSAQLIAAQLIGQSAPGLVVVLTIAVVNLRHMLYSASIAPYFARLPARWKALSAYLLTDEAYAATILHFEREGIAPAGNWFFLGAGLGLWTTWQISSAAGIFFGALLPASWPVDFAIPVTFIAMVVPALRDRPAVAAALSAGLAALMADGLPYNLGLILAAAVGIAVGAVLEGRRCASG
ncbi:MAG: AzlC family ABC transporter permease [Anaerolineales bacterium]|nr:AzlC family ABC transporter permease [Anaerolineales bacterium]